MKKGLNTRQAFINSVMYSMCILQKGVQKALDQLTKLEGRSANMITNLDALAADQHSSKLTIVNKKLQKAISAVADAKKAVDDVVEEVESNIPVTEEVDCEDVALPEDEEETEEPNFNLDDNEDDVLIEG